VPIPTLITELSQTAASNGLSGSDAVADIDNHIRALASFIALLRDGRGYAAEASVASSATTDIGGTNSLLISITGTTTITSFGTNYTGPRFVRFAGALTLTHNATTLILPGGANILTAAGDRAIVTPTGTGWVVSQYQRATLPYFSAHASVNQSISSAVLTKVTLGTELADTASAFASSTFTVPVAGIYAFDGAIRMDSTNATTWFASLYKNGSEVMRGDQFSTAANSSTQVLTVSALLSLAVNDTIELWGYADGTSPRFHANTPSSGPRLSGALIRAF
jgi:hypothetical protein